MEQRILDNIVYMLEKIQSVDSYAEILTRMFDEQVFNNKVENSLMNLNDHSIRTFGINQVLWIDFFSLSELPQLPVSVAAKFKTAYTLLKKIKNIYGPTVMRMDLQEREPFMLVGTTVHINLNESSHTIRFIRADQKHMNFQFKPETLMRSNIIMTQALHQSIASGIYNLNSQSIEQYLETITKMSTLLNSIKENE